MRRKAQSADDGEKLNVIRLYYGMRFEWDKDKNRANQKRHGGLSFESAALTFSDPGWVLLKDRVDEYGEQRFHAIGSVFLQPDRAALLLVVHVYREERQNGEEIIRIISAREANQRERRIYFQKAAE
jgi:uncharacterized DUF497 family protein